jgi:hypothetical protein
MNNKLTNKLHWADRVLLEKLIITELFKKFRIFMESENSLSCSQPAICLYSESYESSRYAPILLF